MTQTERKRKGMHQINQSPMQAPYPIRAHKLICAEKRYWPPQPYKRLEQVETYSYPTNPSNLRHTGTKP